MVFGDTKFADYLNSTGIKTEVSDIELLQDFIKFPEETFSSIVVMNKQNCFKENHLSNIIESAYKKLSHGGTLMVELPDYLTSRNYVTTPDDIECICKEFSYTDIRTYKTPLNFKGIYNYIIVANKI